MHIEIEMNQGFNSGWDELDETWESLDYCEVNNPDVVHFASKKVVYRKGGMNETR